jgi:phenylacetate-coenzyme A ligase PaaK-like adenylate-forming protein
VWESAISLARDAQRARREGADGLAARQRRRLAELVDHARANSPYYAELYRGLPDRIEDPALLPVTHKPELMSRFDDWVTDREVTIARVRSFLEDLDLVGTRFLGSYSVTASSGTSGFRGIFLLDDRELAVHHAVRVRALRSWLGAAEMARLAARRGRTAAMVATGGHFVAGAVMLNGRFRRRAIRVMSVYRPLEELVEELNAYRPAILNGYAGTIAILAAEQEAGRLRIDPILTLLSAEALTAEEQDRIARAFGGKLRDSYATTECPFISHSCDRGWLHVNSDWVVLEPLDAEERQVPAGELSDSVAVTNLANRVQPLLRYLLDDRVVQRPDRCPCGNPMPAIQVQGRAADMFTFAANGREVSIAPSDMSGLLEIVPRIRAYQVAQTAPSALRVRLSVVDSAVPEAAAEEVCAAIEGLLAGRGLEHVSVEYGAEGPQQTSGGKYRKFLPLG